VLVELDAFSGRENPKWRLEATDTEEVRRLLSRLGVSSGEPAGPPGLGYRGFILRDGTSTYRVYKGHVRAGHLGLADPSYSIERFLLEHAPDEVAPLQGRIARELGQDR
jgi:hypothetical protein